jgi:hypothetical protein
VATNKANGKSNDHRRLANRAKDAAPDKRPHRAERGETTLTLDCRNGKDRRHAMERRKKNQPVAVQRRQLERRVKVNRRRQIDPTTCERDYTPEEIEFMGAMDEYKRRSGRMFPTCSEVLEVLKGLGYEKRPAQLIMPATELDSADIFAGVEAAV